MNGYETAVFWGVLILLLLMCLTTMKDWGRFARKGYHRLVNALKWQPYKDIIAGENKSGKHHIAIEGENEACGHGSWRDKIFPRSRRSTD